MGRETKRIEPLVIRSPVMLLGGCMEEHEDVGRYRWDEEYLETRIKVPVRVESKRMGPVHDSQNRIGYDCVASVEFGYV